MRNYLKYTNEDIIATHNSSKSMAELLRKLNLRPTGGNYCSLKKN
jgi:hypothetical protein